MKIPQSHFAVFFTIALVGLSLVVTGEPSRAQSAPPSATADGEKIDIAAVASPTKPLPAWLKGKGKFIDQEIYDKRLKGYLTPEGIKVQIVAEAPTVVNPVGMTFGVDGTPYVLEWRPSPGDEWKETPEVVKYKDGSERKVATMKKRVLDTVKTLASSKNNPFWDTDKVILRHGLPSSILLHDGWLYLSGRGSIWRYKQNKSGGDYDIKEEIARGFCGFHHHQVSGMTIGNDGWLYITSGDDDNIVEGSDGSRATVLRTGAVFRCRPDGSHMQTYSLGYRNPYRDVAFDTAFNMFHVDNDNEDGSKFTGCRLMHVPEGSDFGWRLHGGARCCVPDCGARRRLRRVARQDGADAQDGARFAGRPAHLQRHLFPRKLSRPAALSRRVSQADSRLQGRAARGDVRGGGRVRVSQERRSAVSALPDGAGAGWGHVRRRLAYRLGRRGPLVGRRRSWPHLSRHLERHQRDAGHPDPAAG